MTSAPNPRQLGIFLASKMGLASSAVDIRSKGLREQGLLGNGARGVNSPGVDADMASWVVLGFVAREHIDGGRIAARAGTLSAVGEDSTDMTLFQLISHLIRNVEQHGDVRHISFSPDGAAAWVSFKDGTETVFVEDLSAYDAGGSLGSGSIGYRFTIGIGVLHEIHMKLFGPPTVATWAE